MAEVVPYLSPIRLLVHAGESPEAITLQSVSRARKRLIAELSLSGNELVLDARHYSRNDIQKLLDESQFQELKAHADIYVNQPLRHFLEDHILDEDAPPPARWNIQPEWAPLISSGMGYSLQSASREQLNNQDYLGLLTMMPLAAHISPEYQEEAFSKIRAYLHDLNYAVRNLSWEKFSADESVLYFLFSPQWRDMVNEIALYYPEEVQDLVMKVLDRVYHFQRKATWEYLAEVCKCLRQIRTNSFVQAEVHRFLAVFEDNIRRVKKERTSDWKRYVFYAIWVVILIARIGGSCSHSSADNDDNYYGNQRIEAILEEQRTKVFTPLPNFHERLATLAHYDIDTVLTRPLTSEIPYYKMYSRFSQLYEGDLKVVNHSGFDMVVLLTQVSDVDNYAGIANYYIRNKDSLKVNIPARGVQANFVFGKGWARLSKPVVLSRIPADSVYTMPVYFTSPVMPQPWMRSTFYLGSQLGTVNMNKVGEHRTTFDNQEHFSIRFFAEKGALTYKAEGSDMIYLDKQGHERDSL